MKNNTNSAYGENLHWHLAIKHGSDLSPNVAGDYNTPLYRVGHRFKSQPQDRPF